MPLKVKICGITNLEDAQKAIELGADMLGFNFYSKSSRYIDPEKALEIVEQLPAHIDTVALFVNPKIEEAINVLEEGFFNWIQLHGDETPEFLKQLDWLNVRTIKAIRIQSKEDFDKAKVYPVDVILLDAFDPDLYGGTGKTFDWNIIESLSQRIFLAGGITPDNVVQAAETGVEGIDVCSGVEVSPGKKDYTKMKSLCENAHNARHW